MSMNMYEIIVLNHFFLQVLSLYLGVLSFSVYSLTIY